MPLGSAGPSKEFGQRHLAQKVFHVKHATEIRSDKGRYATFFANPKYVSITLGL